MATNSPDSLRNVGSDDLSSISSDSNSKSPTAKSLVEKELETLREQAVARNVREKYSGSHSFMSPEEAMAYLSKQRKKTSNPPAPPSNLTSSAEISDWYKAQRQRELEERKKREEAESYLRAYRGGSAAFFIDSPIQTQQMATPVTPVVSSKDRKIAMSNSTPVTPPTTNVSSPSKMETPKSTPSPTASKTNSNSTPVVAAVVASGVTGSKPTDTPLSAQSSIAQLDAYLRTVRGTAALQSKQSVSVSASKSEPNSTTNTPTSSTTPDKRTGPLPKTMNQAATIPESKPVPSKPNQKGTVDTSKTIETSSKAETTKVSSHTPVEKADIKDVETKPLSDSKASPTAMKVLDQLKNRNKNASRSFLSKVMNMKNQDSKQVDPQEVTSHNNSTSNSPDAKMEASNSSTPSIRNELMISSKSTSPMKPGSTNIMRDSPTTDKKSTVSTETSPSHNHHPFDEDISQVQPKFSTVKINSEHRETQVNDSQWKKGGNGSLAVGQLDSFLRSSRGGLPPSDVGRSTENFSAVPSKQISQPSVDPLFPIPGLSPLAAVHSQSSLTTTSSISGDSLIPTLEKKPSQVALKVDTSWNDRISSHDSDDQYFGLLDDDALVSVQKHHGLNLSLVTPNVARNPKSSFSDRSKDTPSTTSPYRVEPRNSTNMMKYSTPAYEDGLTPSFQQIGNLRKLSEDVIGSTESMKSTLQLLDSTSFQNDHMDLLAQDIDVEEDRFGSFQSGGKITGRNIWTDPSDDRSLDGCGSVLTSTSTSSKSISQNTEYRSSSTFQRLVQQQKEKYERRLKTRAEEHVEQIDEIIQQLNNIEVKYQADISNLRASLTVKESNLVSLNALISQARLKNAKLMDEAAQHQAKYSAQRVEYDGIFKIQKELEASILEAQNETKKTLAQREKLISDAIRSAQEEIKVAAEKQFAQSNIAFIQLKKDLVVVDDEKKMWIKRAGEASGKLDDINSNSNRHIDDLTRQVNKAKEELEYSKTDVSRMKQQLLNERIIFSERVEIMTRDSAKLGKDCAEAHQLAETIEREKSHLKREVDELKALSDELMSLVGV